MTFGSLGYGPQTRSVLHCHGVLALRGGPWPGAVQDESWQAKSRSRPGASFYSRFRKWRLALWAAGRAPDPSFTAMVFAVQKATSKLEVGRQSQGLELVSSRFRKWLLALCLIRPSLPWCFAPARGRWPGAVQDGSWQAKSRLGASFYNRFRKWRLALWATGRGPGPSFTAMVFWPCEGSLAGSCAGWKLAGKVKAWS